MSDNIKITLTKKEQKVLFDLLQLGRSFPKSLELFGWCGTLMVIKKDAEGRDCIVSSVPGVYACGGDPSNCYSTDPDDYRMGDIMSDDLVDISLE